VRGTEPKYFSARSTIWLFSTSMPVLLLLSATTTPRSASVMVRFFSVT